MNEVEFWKKTDFNVEKVKKTRDTIWNDIVQSIYQKYGLNLEKTATYNCWIP